MLNENPEKAIESHKKLSEISLKNPSDSSSQNGVQLDTDSQFTKEKIFLSLYIVFSVLSAFLLGVMVEKFVILEENKSPVYYSKVK